MTALTMKLYFRAQRSAFALTATLVCCSMAVGQVNVAMPMDSGYYLPYRPPLKDAYLYLQFNTAYPIGRFGDLPAHSASLLAPLQGKTGMGASWGYGLEFGGCRAFVVKHVKPSRIYPFWGLAMGAAYVPLRWKDLGGQWTGITYSGIAQAAGLVRLGMAVKHKGKWVLEAYGSALLPATTFYPEKYSIGQAGLTPEISLRLDESSVEWTPGFTAGLTWRTRHFRVGVEWFEHHSQVDYSYSTGDPDIATPVHAKFDWTAARGNIGFQF